MQASLVDLICLPSFIAGLKYGIIFTTLFWITMSLLTRRNR